MLRAFIIFAGAIGCVILMGLEPSEALQAWVKNRHVAASAAVASASADTDDTTSSLADDANAPSTEESTEYRNNFVKLGGAVKLVLMATYTCRDKTGKGEGCSAGCGSASFAPLRALKVVLASVQMGERHVPMYYYVAYFPKPTSKTSNSPQLAQGFILNAASVCGTVNMDLSFSQPQPQPQPQH
jgi:hypothetical protein